MALPNQRKPRSKPSKSRPSTSSINQPVVNEAALSNIRSAFSSSGDLFALLSLGIDKHRLRVYDVSQAQSIAEYSVADARVTSLTWVNLDVSDEQSEDVPSKKRKKRNSVVTGATSSKKNSILQLVALGLSDGSTVLFSPIQNRVVRTLSHPSATKSILAITSQKPDDSSYIVWTSDSEGTLRSWDARKNEVLSTSRSDERNGYTVILTRLNPAEDDRADILAARHNIHFLKTSTHSLLTKPTEASKSKISYSFTGHASLVTSLCWEEGDPTPSRFFSIAEGDRFVSYWEFPDSTSKEGKLTASIPTDAELRHISFSSLSGRPVLLFLTNSSILAIVPIPQELSSLSNLNKSSQNAVPTLLPKSTFSLSNDAKIDSKIVSAAFIPDQYGKLRIAKLIGGVRPVFDVVSFIDDRGQFITESVIQREITSTKINGVDPFPKRYAEPTNLVVANGSAVDQELISDPMATHETEGNLDVDLAELSLGQRLSIMNGGLAEDGNKTSDSELDDGAAPSTSKAEGPRKRNQQQQAIAPANSLTRTLTQALHSSDSKLLETCLAHSDESLIQNTVRKLPAQLTIPLLMACMERLGRGGRAGNMKGRGGGASSQRGTSLISWIRAVLAIHSGYLMTVPDLVARLSSLHATLTRRLTLQERLLALNGRLDLVLSQIEMRSVATASKHKKKKATSTAPRREPKHYVEGESSEEDEQMEVEADNDDDAGSVEEVQLGNESQDEDLDDEENGSLDEGEQDEDESDEDGPHLNGFIDDEAEEDDYEDESDDESD